MPRGSSCRHQSRAERCRVLQLNSSHLLRHRPRPPHAAELLGDSKAGLKAILVKAGAEIRTAEPAVPFALQPPQPRLGSALPRDRKSDAS